MIKCDDLYKIFKKYGFTYFTGVPDSTFKQWMCFLQDNNGKGLINRIAAIERDAIGWAAAYYVATGKIGVIYMQNSGLGNTVNPITSLIDPYKIPILLMVGWRGEPGKKDEPQHISMGKLTIPLLQLLGIKYSIIPNEIDGVEEILAEAREYMKKTNKIYAIVIRKGIFEDYISSKKIEQNYEMKREDAIKIIVDNIGKEDVIVSTTGKTSRELFEYRKSLNQGHQKDFLMVGSMGLASSFGAEIALQKPDKKVFVLDGDGAAIMSQGTLSIIGYYAPKNLCHIIIDNESYESTGEQPTTSNIIDFKNLALANNYTTAKLVKTEQELIEAIKKLSKLEGPLMLIIKVKKGARKNLGRPSITPIENKKSFMQFLR